MNANKNIFAMLSDSDGETNTSTQKKGIFYKSRY